MAPTVLNRTSAVVSVVSVVLISNLSGTNEQRRWSRCLDWAAAEVQKAARQEGLNLVDQ